MTALRILAVLAMGALTAWGCAQVETAVPEGFEYSYVTRGKITTRELVPRVNLSGATMVEAKAEAPAKAALLGDTYSYIPAGKANQHVVRHNVVLAPEAEQTKVVRSNPSNPEPGSHFVYQGKQPERVLVHEVKVSQ
jgi:hypothetical protein